MEPKQNLKKLICFIFGHQYRLLRKISDTTREIKCKRCKAEFGMNDDCKVVLPMDDDLRQAHKYLLER